MLQHALPREVHVQLPARVIFHSRQGAGNGCGGVDAKASAGVVEVNKHAAIFSNNGFQRLLDQVMAIALGGGKHVACEAMRMDTHERRSSSQFTAHESDVLL